MSRPVRTHQVVGQALQVRQRAGRQVGGGAALYRGCTLHDGPQQRHVLVERLCCDARLRAAGGAQGLGRPSSKSTSAVLLRHRPRN